MKNCLLGSLLSDVGMFCLCYLCEEKVWRKEIISRLIPHYSCDKSPDGKNVLYLDIFAGKDHLYLLYIKSILLSKIRYATYHWTIWRTIKIIVISIFIIFHINPIIYCFIRHNFCNGLFLLRARNLAHIYHRQ